MPNLDEPPNARLPTIEYGKTERGEASISVRRCIGAVLVGLSVVGLLGSSPRFNDEPIGTHLLLGIALWTVTGVLGVLLVARKRSTRRRSMPPDVRALMNDESTNFGHRLDYAVESPSPNYGVSNDPPPVPPWARYAAGTLLLCLVLAAAFGFLATYEPGFNGFHWRVGHMIFGLSCFVSGLWLILKK